MITLTSTKQMTKVPYLIVGNGKISTHLIHYFNLLGIHYSHWHREIPVDLIKLVRNCEKILLGISDDAIEKFLDTNKTILSNKVLVHFSGIKSFNDVVGIHPLMSFSDASYDLTLYQSIHFVIDIEIPLKEFLPELPNSFSYISKNEKPFYHAMCSLSGNLTTFVWIQFFSVLSEKYGITKNQILPYLKGIYKNLIDLEDPMTGPLKRNDLNAVQLQKHGLKDSDFEKLFDAFVDTYDKTKKI